MGWRLGAWPSKLHVLADDELEFSPQPGLDCGQVSGICMNRTQAGEHADMVPLTGINGKTFDMARIDVETNLGTNEVWEVISAGMAHPFHIHHGALFRILSLAGAPPPPHLVGWKDVVLVEDKAE